MGKKIGALLLCLGMTAVLFTGCSSSASVSEDMIPSVTNLASGQEETEADTAEVTALAMNMSYVAELTRLDGDNTEKAKISQKDTTVVLKATSVDKDLKVKIVSQQSGKVITGTAFEIAVTDADNQTKTYTDSDKDGIIYISSMTAGSCKISLTSAGGYSAAKDITATVKANIEYSVVDVSDEIKSESEINVAKEDTNTTGNADAGTATVLTDTVEYVASTKTEITEEVKTQKKDAWGQNIYSKQKTDKYGTPMYAKILSEPAADHTDSNNDNICDRCGATIAVQHTHSYNSVVTAPTCTEKGYTTYTCTAGDDSYVSDYTDALGHADENGDGLCDRCGTSMGTTPTPAEPETPTPSEGTESQGVDTSAAVRSSAQLRLVTAAVVDRIVYDTSSAPVYDTSSEPVYETTTQVTGYKYTGWQTLEGATYYFDKNGNKVTGTQTIQGIQYTFSDEGVRSGTIGIDVSKYQSSINWTKVKNAGINFVMIRCGYRGYGSGVLVKDSMFASHITGAKAAGLRVGVYFFSQAITEAEAVEEASMAVKLARQYGINMPIAIDSEYAHGGSGRADGLSKSERTKITIAFCNTVASAGYKPMVYASKSWFSSHLNVSQFPSSYRIWVAHYAASCGYTGRYDIWQNTSKGSVDGVSGRVDMNISSI